MIRVGKALLWAVTAVLLAMAVLPVMWRVIWV